MSKVPGNFSGNFVRWELMTTHLGKAEEFYRSLMGWTIQKEEIGDGGVYAHIGPAEAGCGGLYEMASDLALKAAAPHWTAYLAVDDLDFDLLRAKSLGAKVTVESIDFLGLGRMALIQDPAGAPVGLWQFQKANHAYSESPDIFAWHELSTSNLTSSLTFYQQLLGWRLGDDWQGSLSMKLMENNACQVAGILSLGKQFSRIPSHWLPYFCVPDVRKAMANVESNGGRLFSGPVSSVIGMQAVAQDPQGAVFGLIQLQQRG